QRALCYQRAKQQVDTRPFGTQIDTSQVGYEWINHSLAPHPPEEVNSRIDIGGPDCKSPYSASILNISGMSYGALSSAAVLALNGGARLGHFAHNTGEGGLSGFHLQPGGDLIWQIGTGYFGCRDRKGYFDPVVFRDKAQHPHIKMIELKLSQGAKPGHGGILPAAKITPEIAELRGVPMGEDALSPPAHSAFSTPIELCHFIAKLREESGGKPTGLKLCIGKRREFVSIAKAMLETGILPDFISVDGGEGGTGAAPMEFANRMGTPLREGLIFVHNVLTGFGLRKHIRINASGRIITAFDLISKLCMGADYCSSARGMMFALGCIQALKCNTNECPTGVTTSDPYLTRGLVPARKEQRVFHFHERTIFAAKELIGAMGISHTTQLRPWHLNRRVGHTEVRHYGELFNYLEEGVLLDETTVPQDYLRAWKEARADSFKAN
ncbi:MAG: FMN-binding glutamate synthase family protein, partial [Chlamydiia bacterium]|nr:FMN-binding glutamate synthase family protein [Chlamydiia bacterium]